MSSESRLAPPIPAGPGAAIRFRVRLLAAAAGMVIPAGPAWTDGPGRVLDLSCWKLTLPVEGERDGRPREIAQPELNSFSDPRCFFVHEASRGVVFRARCGGVATKGSAYPRCELREMEDARGGRPASWGTDDGGVHTLSVRLAVTKTPPVKPHVVCVQIHDARDDLLMVRLERTKLFIERKPLDDVPLASDYALGTPFDLVVQAGGGRVRVWHDGVLKLDWATARDGCYFKAGCYTQSNPGRGDAPDSYGEVVIYSLDVRHSPPSGTTGLAR